MEYTVKELIDELKTCDPDAKISMSIEGNYIFDINIEGGYFCDIDHYEVYDEDHSAEDCCLPEEDYKSLSKNKCVVISNFN